MALIEAPGRRGTDPDDDLTRFAGIRDWVFDLDNTLYPKSAGLWSQIDDRIGAFVQQLLSLPKDEAAKLQRGYYERYGATLRGLMLEHGIAPDEFLEYVHDIDHSGVKADPALAEAIGRLPGRRFILTNGSRQHAERVAEKLGFTGEFEDIFDIVWAAHLPKPSPEVYARLVAETGLDPKRAAMFEDLPRNLVEPQRMGMTTVLVLPEGTRELFKADWDLEGGPNPAADFLTEDLGGFIAAVADAIA